MLQVYEELQQKSPAVHRSSAPLSCRVPRSASVCLCVCLRLHSSVAWLARSLSLSLAHPVICDLHIPEPGAERDVTRVRGVCVVSWDTE